MKQVRISYIVSMTVTFLLMVLFDSWYMLAVFGMQMVFPLVLRVLLMLDARYTHTTPECQASCKMGESTPLKLHFQKEHFSMVTGLIEVTATWDNRMLGESRTEQFRFYLKGKEEVVPVPLDFYCCGEILVRRVQVRCYDVFGLCRRTLAVFENCRIHVNPFKLDIRVLYDRLAGGSVEDEWETLPRKGRDVGEVYDLREYQPGDSMRTIHWKMSAKLDELITKESGDTLHTESFILLDLGRRMSSGEHVDKRVLSAVVSFSQVCCRSLIDQGVNFMTAYSSRDKLYIQPVSSQPELVDVVYTWMGIQMPARNGTSIRFWKRDLQDKTFSHMIYITGGRFPDELFTEAQNTKMTAVCITENGDSIQFAEHENIHMIEIPYRLLNESRNVVLI